MKISYSVLYFCWRQKLARCRSSGAATCFLIQFYALCSSLKVDIIGKKAIVKALVFSKQSSNYKVSYTSACHSIYVEFQMIMGNVMNKQILVEYMSTRDMIAYLFAKALDCIKHEVLRKIYMKLVLGAQD